MDVHRHNGNMEREDSDRSLKSRRVERRVGTRLWLQLHTVTEHSYSGLLLLALHWHSDVVHNCESRDTGWLPDLETQHQLPDLAIALSSVTEEFERTVFVRPSTGDVCVWLGLRITVMGSMPLHYMPFDRQQLRLTLNSGTCILHKWALQDPPKKLQLAYEARVSKIDLSAWRLVKVSHFAFHEREVGMKASLSVFLQRDTSFYFWNGLLLTFVIVVANASLMGLSVDDVGNRLATSVTLLLAQVSQKLFAAQTLPVVNYLTLMDWHSIAGLVLIVLSIAEVVIVGRMARSGIEHLVLFDDMFHGTIAVLWVTVHACCFFFADRLRPSWDKVGFATKQWEDVQWETHRR
eukprot:gnl/TRDRNA2_/TRDRNA2_153356_c0_seq1.p1 gnl/TRDRNA2_/TRDRNA2_153356_c0~~gnl/TRDRNA2_/TRDRNA2_153356_c0_seq1.p1  ORF type:complete len:358 (-),score=32.11 gnl/TRDRNA2_/TRDRNA2_153356_c0_seq1:217-1263(-)